MPLFRRRSEDDKERTEAARLEREGSLAALEQGSIPLAAQRRLDEVRAGQQFFTSDLSVNEFLLARQVGVQPLSQVMGSAVYHVGWQGINTWGYSGELTTISQALNAARSTALQRLAEEATRAGADAVIGVHLDRQGLELANTVEFQAIGTAVRLPRAPHGGVPALTNLSGQDFWTLFQAGYWPLGVVAGSTVYHAIPSWGNQWAMSAYGGQFNQELSDFTRGVYEARAIAMGRVREAARHMHAGGIVGVRITQSHEEYEVEMGGGRRTDLIITFDVIGTAVSALEHAHPPTPPAITVDLRS